MKKILIVGATGTIGQAVVKELSPRYQLLAAGMSKSELKVDITDHKSIENLYKQVGKIDGVVVTAGRVHFGLLSEMNAEQYEMGLMNKLMGQVNLVRLGLAYMNDGGSFTLTSGILNQDPIVFGSSAAMVNGAIDAFVKAAAIEMSRGIRINSVSPTVLTESITKYESFFRGYKPVPAVDVALAYSKSVEGAQTGQVLRVGY